MPARPRIQHVSIPRPPGSHEETRAFYSGLLGLEEIAVPNSIASQDLIWYRLGDTELHLFAEEPIQDPSTRHVCIEFDDVEEIRERLVAAGYEPWEPERIPGRPRYFCRDPFQNILELTSIWGDYTELQQSEQT